MTNRCGPGLKMWVGMLTLRNTLLAVRLHGDVGIKMVQGAVGFLAAIPATLVHPLDLLIAPARSLVLLGAGNGYEAEDLDTQTC